MRTCVAFSGGIDSTAMLLRLIEIGKRPNRIIFADTMFNYPGTYDYIRKIEKHINQKIWRLPIWKRVSFFEQFMKVKQKGKYTGQIYGFPTKSCPWVAYEKYKALYEATRKFDEVYIGFTVDERRMTRKQFFRKKNYRFPLIDWVWRSDRCLTYLKSRDMVNPAYYKFGKVWSCWFCPRQSFHTLQVLKREQPELFNVMKMLNSISPHTTGFKLERDKQRMLLL